MEKKEEQKGEPKKKAAVYKEVSPDVSADKPAVKPKSPPTIEVEQNPEEKTTEEKQPAENVKDQTPPKEKVREAVKKVEVKASTSSDEEPQKRKQRSFLANFGLGQDREYFIENLSVLLGSGMNIIAALDALKGGLRSKRMHKIIEQIKTDVNNGSPIWKSLNETGLLTDHAISLIRIGEESGRLSANLKVISVQDQKERVFRSKLFSAMMYPVVVLFMTLIIGIGIAWFILPRLTGVFTQMNVKLPVTTRILIIIGTFLAKYGGIVIPAVLVTLLLLFYLFFVHKRTRFIGQRIVLVVPGIKNLIQQIELARFGFVLGNLLSAGMPLVDALNSLQEISSYFVYLKFYAFLRNNVEEGNSFQKSFGAYRNTSKLIPFPIQQMIVASEQSGSLKETFLSIGEIYDEKTDISTKNLAVILEPVLLFVVWLVVVFVALSVIMPIYSLIGGFNK